MFELISKILDFPSIQLRDLVVLVNGDPRYFFRGCSFAGIDVRGQDLSIFDLTGVDLREAVRDKKTVFFRRHKPEKSMINSGCRIRVRYSLREIRQFAEFRREIKRKGRSSLFYLSGRSIESLYFSHLPFLRTPAEWKNAFIRLYDVNTLSRISAYDSLIREISDQISIDYAESKYVFSDSERTISLSLTVDKRVYDLINSKAVRLGLPVAQFVRVLAHPDFVLKSNLMGRFIRLLKLEFAAEHRALR